ncbi:MAG: hypothetical protein AAF387_07170 [Pseudomonadota bacterium]
MNVTNLSVADESPKTGSETSLRLFNQQKPWLVFLLIVLTFSVYTLPWFYRHASNLRKISGRRYVPWVWLLVPIFAITVPFATNRLFEGFREAAAEKKLNWNESGLLSGVLAFVMFTAARAVDRLDGPVAYIIASNIVLAIIFALLSRKLNRFYDQLEAADFRTLAYKITTPSWISLVIAGPVVLLLYGLGLQQDWYRYLQPVLPQNQIYEISDLPITLRTPDRWSIVKSGTKSDGTAELELVGSYGDSFALIFDHPTSGDLDSVMEHRRDFIFQTFPEAQCSERRKLDPQTLIRRAELTCTGVSGIDSVAWFGAVIDTNTKMYEFYGVTTAPTKQFHKAKAALKKLSKNFQYAELQ